LSYYKNLLCNDHGYSICSAVDIFSKIILPLPLEA
jgi:hypothetical protein